MDALSETLSSIKTEGSVYFCDHLSPPWKMDKEPEELAAFHYIRRGHCNVRFNDQNILLTTGDLVVLGHGDRHSLSSTKPETLHELDTTHILCGYFKFRSPIPRALSNALPAFVVVTADEIAARPWLKRTLEHLSTEYDAQSPGAAVIVNKLTEVVLIELIRLQLDKSGTLNFISALSDKQIGKALNLLHLHPQKYWTLDILANEVAMSRSAFARKFKQMVGQPMFQYLTEVRIRISSDLLRYNDKSVQDIAENVGYSSDIAFAKVFKEHIGISPVAYRKQHRLS